MLQVSTAAHEQKPDLQMTKNRDIPTMRDLVTTKTNGDFVTRCQVLRVAIESYTLLIISGSQQQSKSLQKKNPKNKIT
jgi:hypothetical protein